MLDDVNLLVEFVVMSVFIRSHKDNYRTTLLFQAYAYSMVMLLIVLYDGDILVRDLVQR